MARRVLLAQLPIPPAGAHVVEGNVPLAAAYLKLVALRRGLDEWFEVDLFPPAQADVLGDQALLAEFVARRPAIAGFTCYLWNIERTLWLCRQLKERLPDLVIVLGGPEITPDNRWVFAAGGFDYAVFGEGEETFCDLLATLATQRIETFGNANDPHPYPSPASGRGEPGIPGLTAVPDFARPATRPPLADLDQLSSPYLAGILAADRTLFLETARGCRFNCKFCYYPKSFAGQQYLSERLVRESLQFARRRRVAEVFLLDPTLNQRSNFPAFVDLLAEENREQSFTYSAELRAEGIDASLAAKLRAANFAEVEIGLQSVDPGTQQLIGRRVNMPAFLRGAQALLAAGVRTRVDLIVGLPGDTAESIRRGIEYLVEHQVFSALQLFNLSVLPGTALRGEAETLGLQYQPRPPYYVTQTPTLDLATMAEIIDDAQAALGIEFDPAPLPEASPGELLSDGVWRRRHLDLDRLPDGADGDALLTRPPYPAHAAALWLKSGDFHARRQQAARIVARLLAENPFTSLDVVFDATAAPQSVSIAALAAVHAACFQQTTYLDRFFSVQLAPRRAAKRLFIVLPGAARGRLSAAWIADVAEYAAILWRGDVLRDDDLAEHEYTTE